MRRPIVIANWKMYGSLSDAIVLATGIRDGIENFSGVEIILCPPAIWLTEVAGIIHKRIDQLALGAQNIHYLSEGEFTGEISATMVCDVARYAIVGHSERRKNFGETASIVARKAAAALDAGLSPIVCVGEQKKSEDSVQKVVDELKELLSDVRKSEYRDIVVAYEPVWAVGANESATPEYSARVIVKLREIVSAETPILYGGSVNAANVYSFVRRPEIDGVLVGRAGLKVGEFVKICRIVAEYKKII